MLCGVEGAFEIVLFVVVGVAVVGAIVSLVLSGDAYSGIGRGGMSIGEDRPLSAQSGAARGGPASADAATAAAQAAEREADIRSMLEARAARRLARGEAPGDVESELAALLGPGAGASSGGSASGPGGVDPELEAEVRQLVESRNARRIERGQEPLDVDAEVARRLREYGA
jgi:hypothetical protein